MAKCIQDVLNINVSSGGTLSASDTDSTSSYSNGNGTYASSSTSSNGDITFADNFVDAISSVTNSLSNTNCTDVIEDFFSNKFSDVSSAVSKSYDWVSENLNLQSGMTALSNKIKSSSADSLVEQFCEIVTNLSKTLIFYIDAGVKAAFVIFKKIDALKKKIERALLEFTDEVRDCLVSVIVDAKVAIDKTVNSILDFDVVLDLMNHCDCVASIIANMFDCASDDDGNEYTDNADILNCVLTKYSLDASSVISAVNSFIDNTLLDNINKGFNKLDEFIKTTMELLIAPFRELIRLYAKLLTKKINVTTIVRGLGVAECLLIYTKEYRASGSAYLGMSIIDMINTLKSWVNCFEFACSSFVEDISVTIKEYNEDLRLDDKYWRSVLSIDLYQAAIGAKVQATQPRASMIREIFVKNQDKGKNVFISIIDVYKQVGKIDVTTTETEETLGDCASAVKYKDGPEKEDNNNVNGKLNISSSIEDNLMNIERNLAADSDYFYVEKLLQLVNWEAKYKKSSIHTDLIDTLVASQQTNDASYNDTHSSVTYETNSSREYYKGDGDREITEMTPSYEVTDDYDSSVIEKIESYKKPTRKKNQSLYTYYKNWYSEAIA